MKESLPLSYIDYYNHGGYEIFLSEETQPFQKVKQKLTFLNKEMERATGLKETYQLADEALIQMGLHGVSHLVFNPYEGQLNPARLCHALSKKVVNAGIPIWNGMYIKEILPETNRVTLMDSEGNQHSARKLIVATNGFTKQLLPETDLYPVRNQVLITEEIPDLSLKGTFHYHEGYVYFRNVGKRILLGGARHIDKEGEQTDEFGEHEEVFGYLKNFLGRYLLPNHTPRVYHSWSGILGMGQKKEPLVSFPHPNVLLAVRLGGMGVALGWEVGSNAASEMMGRL